MQCSFPTRLSQHLHLSVLPFSHFHRRHQHPAPEETLPGHLCFPWSSWWVVCLLNILHAHREVGYIHVFTCLFVAQCSMSIVVSPGKLALATEDPLGQAFAAERAGVKVGTHAEGSEGRSSPLWSFSKLVLRTTAAFIYPVHGFNQCHLNGPAFGYA